MPAGNINHASPTPSRILRPRPNTQVSKGRSNTRTSSPTILSPIGSADYTQRDNHTPEATHRGSSPISSPTVDNEPGNEASHIAVRGSVPPSPILKARRLKVKEPTYSPAAQVPSPGGWTPTDDKPRTDDDSLAKSSSIDESVEDIAEGEDTAFASIPVPRTANNGRVIAIDLDLVLPRPAPHTNGPDSSTRTNGEGEPIQGAHVQVIDEPEFVMYPTQMKGATSGLLLALKQLRALGHPLHLVASRAPSERSEIEFWLPGQGIAFGTDDEDVVAALWFTASAATTPSGHVAPGAGAGRGRGGLWPGPLVQTQKHGDTRIKVLRAMNAALFVTAYPGLEPALVATTPDLSVLVLDQRAALSPKSGDGLDAGRTGRFDPVEDAKAAAVHTGHGGIEHKGRWGEVVAWVKAWDSK